MMLEIGVAVTTANRSGFARLDIRTCTESTPTLRLHQTVGVLDLMLVKVHLRNVADVAPYITFPASSAANRMLVTATPVSCFAARIPVLALSNSNFTSTVHSVTNSEEGALGGRLWDTLLRTTSPHDVHPDVVRAAPS